MNFGVLVPDIRLQLRDGGVGREMGMRRSMAMDLVVEKGEEILRS